MGLEVEIIYLFAKAKHYNINLIEIKLAERVSLLKSKKLILLVEVFLLLMKEKKILFFQTQFIPIKQSWL